MQIDQIFKYNYSFKKIMDSVKDTFEFHLLALSHHVFIPILDPELDDALQILMTGKLTPEKYPYYLMQGMLNAFDIVHKKVGMLESQNASFKNQIQSLQERIENLEKK